MTYQNRLQQYESEKQKLIAAGLTAKQYEIAISALAKKWKI